MFWENAKPFIAHETIHGVRMKVYEKRPQSLYETLEKSVTRFPDKVALVHGNVHVTYQELKEKVNAVAYTMKHTYSIQKGDRVALLLMNGVPFVIATYAALQIGAIVVPLNTKLETQELEYMLRNSKANMLITNEEWWPKVKPIVGHQFVNRIVITADEVPSGTTPFHHLLKEKSRALVQESITETDAAFIMYTSGTTGRPKGALITHFNMIHTCLNYTYCYRLSSNDSTLIAVPIFHITGLAAQLMTFIFLGGKAVLMPMFQPKKFLTLLEREHITHVIASPTVYVMTLLEPDYKHYEVSHWRVCAFGGAPMPSETLQALKKWNPSLELHNTYGLTETTSPATIMPDDHQLRKLSSVGVPTPVTDAKVVDPETRKELGPNKVGELLFKGPMVIFAYWNNPEATEEALQHGWLATGDLASIDQEGFITIMDRIKDMINRGGEKIFSVEVEDTLYSHPAILEAAIVGVPDETYGEVVKACIVLKPNEMMTHETVRAWVRQHLAKFKVPQYVEFFDQLPRNPNGKVIKTKLRYIPKTKEEI